MRRDVHQRGFTLIEIVIVILIIASAMTVVTLGFGATSRTNLRSGSWTLASAARFAYSRAVTQGLTTRIVLDFEARTLQVQETKGRVVLNRDDESGTGLRREGDDAYYLEDGGVEMVSLDAKINAIGPDLGLDVPTPAPGGLFGGGGSSVVGQFTDPYLSAMSGGNATGSPGGPARYMGPRFEPVEGRRGETRKLDGTTGYRKVFTPHEAQPREDGKAYIYFFPGGVTEHTIIQLSDGDSDDPLIYSVEIHPLSGRPDVYTFELEPEEELDDLQEAKQ